MTLRSAAMLCLLTAAPMLMAASPLLLSPLGCPPVKTETRTPTGETIVLSPKGDGLEATRLAGPFDQPRSIGFMPDGRFLISERLGKLKLVAPWVGTVEITGLPEMQTAGHGGITDVALDPGFEQNGLLYIAYLHGSETASTQRIMKARLDLDNAALVDNTVIFETTPGARPEQIGGRLAVTPDGYLFFSVGDRWSNEPAQDLTNDLGTIIRIRTDGGIPANNPFVNREGVRPEIWSYGHRNPQGLAYDARSGRLWSDEHGPQGGDELNLVLPGRDYGWPIITYGIDYSGASIGIGSAREGLEQPVHYWVRRSIAPSGLAVQSDETKETIWISALAGEMVVKLTLGANCSSQEEHLLKNEIGRLRDIRVGPRGNVFVLTDGREGLLYRLDEPPIDTVRAGARL